MLFSNQQYPYIDVELCTIYLWDITPHDAVRVTHYNMCSLCPLIVQKLSVHCANELRDKMQARCTVHRCMQLWATKAPSVHFHYSTRTLPVPVCALQ